MKRSDQRIITTHVGSLPRPDDLMALYRENASDENLQPQLRSAVSDIVRRQLANGIDVINDGEYGKAMRSAMDFGAWWSYVYPRLEGFELREEQAKKGRAAWTFGSKERKDFAEFYAAEASAAASAARQSGSSSAQLPTVSLVTGPVKYVGHAAIARDIDNMAAAARASGVEEVFMTAVSPATLQILPQRLLRQVPEEYTCALGRGDSRGIRRPSSMPASSCRSTTAALVDIYDWWFSMNDDIAGFRKWAAIQVEAGQPRASRHPGGSESVVHICWGSWHGRHKGDVPLKEVVDLLLKVIV